MAVPASADLAYADVVSADDDAAAPVRAAYAIEQRSFDQRDHVPPWFAPHRNRLFSQRLAALFAADDRCQEREQGICELGSDPFLDGQDGEFVDLRIATETIDGAHAKVVTRFVSFGHKVTIAFDVKRERGSWRIDDLHPRGYGSIAAHLCRAYCKDLPASLRRAS